MRQIPIIAVLLAASLLAAVDSPAAADSPGDSFRFEILREGIQRRYVQAHLGRSCHQRLTNVGVDMKVLQLSGATNLEDDPFRAEAIKDAMGDCAKRLVRKLLERRLRLEERRDALRDRMRRRRRDDGQPGSSLDISPRLRVGSYSTLGARFRMRHTQSPFWSGLALTVAGELEGSDLKVGLSYNRPKLAAWLSLHTAHPDRGRHGELGVRLSF